MRILSLDGGGYLGLATAAFLSEAERHFRTTCADKFDLFCGTSTGAIIALCLASGMPAQKVVELYKEMGTSIFRARSRMLRAASFAKSAFLSKYDNKL